MTTLLTAQQVQDLINVDRSTVYRMAEDGRLSAVKVGRQWRFPAEKIAEQFGLTSPTGPTALAPVVTGSSTSDLRRLLVPEATQSIADLLGDLFGVMAIVTDIEGRPLSTVANPCGFYAAVADQPGAAEACLTGWRQLADGADLVPRFVPSHLGFLCARAFIRVDDRLVGMVIVGGVTPPEWPPAPETLEALASELGLDVALLADRMHETWDLDCADQQRVLALLPRVADLISQLASARSQLLTKLDAIATLAGPVALQKGTES